MGLGPPIRPNFLGKNWEKQSAKSKDNNTSTGGHLIHLMKGVPMSRVQTSYIPPQTSEPGSYTSSSPDAEATESSPIPPNPFEEPTYRRLESFITILKFMPDPSGNTPLERLRERLDALQPRGEYVEIRPPEACYLCLPEELEARMQEALRQYLQENESNEE